jgi:hypothetical protein
MNDQSIHNNKKATASFSTINQKEKAQHTWTTEPSKSSINPRLGAMGQQYYAIQTVDGLNERQQSTQQRHHGRGTNERSKQIDQTQEMIVNNQPM